MIKSDLSKIAPKLLAASALSLMLTACSAFEPDYVECPDISVSDKADRAYIEGITLGQIALARFNGASSRCVVTDTGYDMQMELGLLLKRDISVSSLSEEVPVDITFAFVDKDGNVVSRHVHSSNVFFPDYLDKSRPLLGIRAEIPAGTRVVMGLGKAVE